LFKVEFVKDYVEEGNHKGIRYKGTREGDKVSGRYRFHYKKLFISLHVSEDFEMTRKAT
jgi:hypothetical protein